MAPKLRRTLVEVNGPNGKKHFSHRYKADGVANNVDSSALAASLGRTDTKAAEFKALCDTRLASQEALTEERHALVGGVQDLIEQHLGGQLGYDLNEQLDALNDDMRYLEDEIDGSLGEFSGVGNDSQAEALDAAMKTFDEIAEETRRWSHEMNQLVEELVETLEGNHLVRGAMDKHIDTMNDHIQKTISNLDALDA